MTVASMYLTEMSVTCQITINKLLDEGHDVVLDRYYLSTLIYETSIEILQLHKQGKPVQVGDNYIRDYLHKMNYLIFGVLNLPTPDITIVLTDPFGVCETDTKYENELDRNTGLQRLTKQVGKYMISGDQDIVKLGKLYTLNISDEDRIRFLPQRNVDLILELLDM